MINENDLIKIDFSNFILLEKGDKIYWKKYDAYFGKHNIIECEITYAKWLFSGENVCSGRTHKPFYYKQIVYVDDKYDEWYSDSAGKNYDYLYISKELLSKLENRKLQKQKRKKTRSN